MRITTLVLTLFHALLVCSQSLDSHSYNGIREMQKKNYKNAIVHFEKASATSNNKEEKLFIFANLAFSYQMEGDMNKALEYYNKALLIDSCDITLRQQRGGIYMYLDSTEKAIQDYSYILDREPSNTNALFCRAQIYANSGQFDKSRADYHVLMSIAPNDDNVHLGYARLYQKEARYNECLMLLGQLIHDNPDRAEFYIARSDVSRELRQFELALLDIEKAIELDHANSEYYRLQSILLEKLGKKEAAKKSRNTANMLKNRNR